MTKEHNRGKRFKNPRGVLAFERYRTIHYESMAECIEVYGIQSTSMLSRLIENGSICSDGYTTFDWASDEEFRQDIFSEIRALMEDPT